MLLCVFLDELAQEKDIEEVSLWLAGSLGPGVSVESWTYLILNLIQTSNVICHLSFANMVRTKYDDQKTKSVRATVWNNLKKSVQTDNFVNLLSY